MYMLLYVCNYCVLCLIYSLPFILCFTINMCTPTEVHVIDIADETITEIEQPLTGINGSEDEYIDIPASILHDKNSTGMCLQKCSSNTIYVLVG